MRAWHFLAILLIVVVAAYAFYAYHTSEGVVPPKAAVKPSATLASITHAYAKGTHTVSGTVLAPDACTNVNATASFASSSDEIRVDIEAPADQGLCLQLPTAVTFSVKASGDSSATAAIYLNGALATTTP